MTFLNSGSILPIASRSSAVNRAIAAAASVESGEGEVLTLLCGVFGVRQRRGLQTEPRRQTPHANGDYIFEFGCGEAI